jgi:hypothetical protein
MAGVCRIVTAMVFAAHMMLGCCAHHAHAADSHGRSSPQEAASPIGHCGEDHDGPADHSQHGTHQCHGGKCSFVASSNSVVPVLPALVVPLANQAELLTSVFSSQGTVVAVRPLPVRLHLANQVLLI